MSKRNHFKLQYSASLYFDYYGDYEIFDVPLTVSYLEVTAHGAQGGHFSGGGTGGYGARVETTLSVAGGTRCYVYVGGQPTDLNGGFNGGAFVDPGGSGQGNCRGGGGGTDLRCGGTALTDRVLSAGGGGGGCGTPCFSAGGHGGQTGDDGGAGVCGSNGAEGGGGGTTTGGKVAFR